MSTKIIGWLAAGVALATGVGALVWYFKRRKAKEGPTPSKPPRGSEEEDPPLDRYEDATPDSQKDNPDLTRHRPAFDFLDRENLPAELVEAIDETFERGWRVDDATIENLEPDEVIVFAVKSEPVGPYVRTVEEVISAHVLEVEEQSVRARVMAPTKHSEHFGNIAGHGLRPGTIVDVPKSKILVAAVEKPGDGYGGRGEPAAGFKPTSHTKRIYKIRPNTPYDLKLPYRTEELDWYVDPNTAGMVHIGEYGLLEQIMFTEDSPRGSVVVRCLDNDPNVGKVLVGRWEFELEA